MVDNVRFTSPDNTTVHVNPEGWDCQYPNDSYIQERITQWEEGRTDEWDAHNEAYQGYQAIMGYDGCLANPPEEGCPKPREFWYNGEHYGYWTQEEVDESQSKWDEWNACEAQYPGECGKEPEVLKLPNELTPISEPPALVPNTIEPYYEYYGWTVEQAKQAKYAEIWAHADTLNSESEDLMLDLKPSHKTDRLVKRHQKISNKKFKEQLLTPQEQQFDTDYDTVLDYQDEVNDTADQAADYVEALTDVDDIMAYDTENTPLWPDLPVL